MSAAIRLNQAKKLIRQLACALDVYASQASNNSVLPVPDHVIDLLRAAHKFAPPVKTETDTKRRSR